MSELPSYPKVWTIGHRKVRGLLDGPVEVQEKVDGSQFSFGVVDDGLLMRSKNKPLDPVAPEALFRPAVDTVVALFERELLPEGWVFRGEAVSKPRHSTLAYERVPAGNVILFDVQPSLEEYLPHQGVAQAAADLGLEAVPLLHTGMVDVDLLHRLLETESVLGGGPVEGLVCKPLEPVFDEQTGKALMLKHVSERFKETHRKTWPKSGQKDVVTQLAESLRSEARWEKAVQRLAEQGTLEESPRDIGALVLAVQEDVLAEEREAIAETLLGHFERAIRKGVVVGLPEWYKERLLQQQFDQPGD